MVIIRPIRWGRIGRIVVTETPLFVIGSVVFFVSTGYNRINNSDAVILKIDKN